MTCKTAYLSDIYKEMGWKYAKTPIGELFPKMKHPIVCANCHDPATMKLRVINPAFIEALQRRGMDIQKATREDMRSYVCGQCHSEYYFEPESKKVVFPWDKGFHPEQMYAYYDGKPGRFRAGTGCIPIPRQRCSRPSIPTMKLGSAASTASRAFPAPTAICRICGRADRNIPPTG